MDQLDWLSVGGLYSRKLPELTEESPFPALTTKERCAVIEMARKGSSQLVKM
jgi:hypothetical protein